MTTLFARNEDRVTDFLKWTDFIQVLPLWCTYKGFPEIDLRLPTGWRLKNDKRDQNIKKIVKIKKWLTTLIRNNQGLQIRSRYFAAWYLNMQLFFQNQYYQIPTCLFQHHYYWNCKLGLVYTFSLCTNLLMQFANIFSSFNGLVHSM